MKSLVDKTTADSLQTLERQFMDGTLHPKACFQLIKLLLEVNRKQTVALAEANSLIAEMVEELKNPQVP